MENVAHSINKVSIRLTHERWIHIVENHDDLAGYLIEVMETIEKPDWIFQGAAEELWAVKMMTPKKALLVIYKETKDRKNGFIITAFFTTKIRKLHKRTLLWQAPQ